MYMSTTDTSSRSQKLAQSLMALCLGVMAVAVFFNVVLRYGFGSGIAASEELSRLLFVWMVFIGATAAYPASEHMAFTSFVAGLRGHPKTLQALTALIRVLVVLSCVMLGRGAWQQVDVGFSSNSVVLGYPNWLLPLPVLLSSLAIGLMACKELIQNKPMDFDHGVDVE
jgi:TRAP-type C4-dicarboxylate transport system permease small subunit